MKVKRVTVIMDFEEERPAAVDGTAGGEGDGEAEPPQLVVVTS